MATELTKELELSTVDFKVYERRRMWRLPNSRHQKTGLYKVHLRPSEVAALKLDEIKEIAAENRGFSLPNQTFRIHANMWFKEWITRFEEYQEEEREQQREIFMRNGATRKTKTEEINTIFDLFGKAKRGSRNNALNISAYKLGIYSTKDSTMDVQKLALELLELALAKGLSEHESRATITSGIAAGRKKGY